VAFLPPGSYVVRIEEPFLPNLDPVITSGVQVTAGTTTPLSVLLPNAGSSGGAYVRISGPTSVGVGGTITLFAAVGDASGSPVQNPSVTWTSSPADTASVTGFGDSARVTGRMEGVAMITATSAGLSDMHRVQITASSAPVATITVVPADTNLTVGDSLAFRADLKDAAGNFLSNRSVSWYTADSTVIRVYAYGTAALVLARAAGTAVLHATSEGKTGQATMRVAVPAPVATVTVVPGSASLTVGDNATFAGDVRDAAGNVLSNRAVSWSSTDPSVSITSTAGASATVRALSAGTAVLRATSEGKTGEASISVAAPVPVATVTVVPDTATLAVGDSVAFRADLRDAAGNPLSNRAVSWSASDSTIISLYGFGDQALVQPRAPGSVVLRATSEGKAGQATITVH